MWCVYDAMKVFDAIFESWPSSGQGCPLFNMVSISTFFLYCCYRSIRTVLGWVCHFPGPSQVVGAGNFISSGKLEQFVGGGMRVLLQRNWAFCRELVFVKGMFLGDRFWGYTLRPTKLLWALWRLVADATCRWALLHDFSQFRVQCFKVKCAIQ